MLKYSFFSTFKFRWLIYFLLFSTWSLWLINFHILSYKRYIIDDCLADFPTQSMAIVLGASVLPSGLPSPIFRDRLETAVVLYHSGKIDNILVSGDGGHYNYNEIEPARNYLLANQVAPDNIFLDYQGFNTFASLHRAKNLFGINQALIITQEFHLPRALYIARNLEITALACVAFKSDYENGRLNYELDMIGYGQDKLINEENNFFRRREFFARIKAWLDINLNVDPHLREEKIDLSQGGQATWREN